MLNKLKKYTKPALKIALTIGALWIVSGKVELSFIYKQLLTINLPKFIGAVILYGISKLVSSYRLNRFYQSTGIWMKNENHLRLYLKGMFYNLLLPGGIGGDGYKAYYLHKNYKVSIKKVLSCLLIDRISGLVGLVLLAQCLVLFAIEIKGFYALKWALLTGISLMLPVYLLFVNKFFNAYKGDIPVTTVQSIAVQVLQVLAAILIVMAMGVTQHLVEYGTIFLFSSIIAIVPLTIGGLGARELTFLLGYQYFGLNKEIAVSLGILFFLATVLCSIPGAFVKEKSSNPA